MKVNPYSTEIRYTLDVMVYHLLKATQPRSVRIASRSAEMVKATIRRLCNERFSLLVESPQMQAMVHDSLGVETQVFEKGISFIDAALFPFSLEDEAQPADESIIVAACWNALSYKGLLYPGTVRGTVFGKMAKLRSNYHLEPVAGLYSPRFIFWWSVAKAVERLDSAWYFRLEDYAMRQLIEFGLMWRLSYVVVLIGRATN